MNLNQNEIYLFYKNKKTCVGVPKHIQLGIIFFRINKSRILKYLKLSLLHKNADMPRHMYIFQIEANCL